MKKKDKTIAILTVHNAAKFTAKGRRDIANWLHNLADTILNDAEKLDTRFRARYIAPSK